MKPAARTDAPAPAVRAARIILVDELGAELITATVVVAAAFPEVVIYDGEPHIPTETAGIYRRVRPYRLDGGF